MKKANKRPIHIKPTGADPNPMRVMREPGDVDSDR
jgi:hypothetical protein